MSNRQLKIAACCGTLLALPATVAFGQAQDTAPSDPPTQAIPEEKPATPPAEPGANQPPPPPSFPGLDEESLPGEVVAPLTAGPPPPPVNDQRGVWAINIGMGFAGGGEDLVTAVYTDGSDETLTAGTGVSITAGTTITPLRSGSHSAGLGVDLGVKGWNIGGEQTDFQLTLTRFPLTTTAHYAYEFKRGIALLASGGLQYEMGVNMSGSGALEDVDLDFESALGWLAEAGVLLEMNALGIDITLRYTRIDYSIANSSDTVEASNIGVFLAIHYALVTTKISRTD